MCIAVKFYIVNWIVIAGRQDDALLYFVSNNYYVFYLPTNGISTMVRDNNITDNRTTTSIKVVHLIAKIFKDTVSFD